MIIMILWVIAGILFLGWYMVGRRLGKILRTRYPNVTKAKNWRRFFNAISMEQIPSPEEIVTIKSDPELRRLGNFNRFIYTLLAIDGILLLIFKG